jgi:hypothetical protein
MEQFRQLLGNHVSHKVWLGDAKYYLSRLNRTKLSSIVMMDAYNGLIDPVTKLDINPDLYSPQVASRITMNMTRTGLFIMNMSGWERPEQREVFLNMLAEFLRCGNHVTVLGAGTYKQENPIAVVGRLLLDRKVLAKRQNARRGIQTFDLVNNVTFDEFKPRDVALFQKWNWGRYDE